MFILNKSIFLSSAIFCFALCLCPFILHAQDSKRNPFIIHSKTPHISSAEIRLKKGTSNNIAINLTNGNAGSTYSATPGDTSNDASWHIIPPPQITDITIMHGLYGSVQKNPDNIRNTVTNLFQVQFPLRIKIEISDQNLDVEFTEAGNWNLNIVLDNIYNPDLLLTPANH